jgi:starch phosphorylase
MRLLIDEFGLTGSGVGDHPPDLCLHLPHADARSAGEVAGHLFERLLPRHLEIIYEINRRFLSDVSARFPNDYRPHQRACRSSRTAASARYAWPIWPASAASHQRRGRTALQLLRTAPLARLLCELWPERFRTRPTASPPRRFIRLANPRLSALITARIGDGWLRDLDQLRGLEPFADDAAFAPEWRAVKQPTRPIWQAFRRAGRRAVDPNSMYDVMVKRLHEYKRQLLKALHIVTLYHQLQRQPVARHRAAHLHLWRQGGPGLLHGQADHQADQQHRREWSTPTRWWPTG